MDATTLTPPPSSNGAPVRPLPDVVHISEAEQHRIPSPGTQRALKAQTGRGWDELVGPDADSADRIQTMIWIHLRTDHPGLRWEDCDEISIQIEEGTAPNPLAPSASGTSPRSAGSGG